MSHTKESIIEEIHRGIEDNPATLYNQPFAFRFGHRQKLSEIAAEELLRCCREGKLVIPQSENKDYFSADHARIAIEFPGHIKEKRDARAMYRDKRVFHEIGAIIDFETPITRRTKENIDLLAYNKEKKLLTLLEYKTAETLEPLLRCVLEVFTYSRRVNETYLKESFHEPAGVALKADVRTAVFVHKDSRPYKHFIQAKDTHIRALMREWKVGFFSIEEDRLLEV